MLDLTISDIRMLDPIKNAEKQLGKCAEAEVKDDFIGFVTSPLAIVAYVSILAGIVYISVSILKGMRMDKEDKAKRQQESKKNHDTV